MNENKSFSFLNHCLNLRIFSSKDSGPVKLWDKDMKKVIKVFKIENDDPNFVNVIKSVSRVKVNQSKSFFKFIRNSQINQFSYLI